MSLIDELHSLRSEIESKLTFIDAKIADLQPESVAPVSASQFYAESSEPMRWLLEGLIAEGSVGLMVAHGGIGKTTLLTQLGLCLADGRPVFGFPVPSAAPVLYVMAEGSRAAYRDRWTLTRRALEIPSTANWFIQPAAFQDFTLGRSGLDALVAQSKAKLVILDTLGYFHQGDENKANDWKAHVMAPLRSMCQRYNATFVLVHHQTKQSPDRQGWQQGRGTSAMYGDVDFWLRLEKVDGDGNESKRELWIDKNKYGPMGYRKKLVFVAEHAFFRSEA